MILHGYFRSSASWRLRIALAFKGLAHKTVSHHLLRGEQNAPAYRRINPQGLVPSLVLDSGDVLTQSLAIIEYLEEVVPEPPLLPVDSLERARVRAAALVIACDVHPLQNRKVLERVRRLGGDEAVQEWGRQAIEPGIEALAELVAGYDGPYCFGDRVTLADICLVPQLANARRFDARTDFGRIPAIERDCLAHPAFAETRPERQPDAQ